MLLSTNNSKLTKAAKEYQARTGQPAIIASFTLPAVLTCPFAGKCAGGCYAKAGAFCWPVPKAKHQANWAATKSFEFVPTICAEVSALVKRAERKGAKLFIRIHDSGDFYSASYLEAWASVARAFPGVAFYAYTKSLNMVRDARKDCRLPVNMVFTFSQGGKLDSTIDPATEKHTRMFNTAEELETAGYANASAFDLVAADPSALRVGLVFHGSTKARKAWGLA